VVTEHSRAELILSADRARPGETLWAALKLELDPGWHTYWRNPGDSGLPGAITWTLPEGVSAGEIVWPVPERIPYGPLMNFGFKDKVLLPVPLTVAETAPVGTATIDAAATWLVCAEICIPDEGTFRVTLPIGGTATPSAHAAEIEAALASMPQPAPWPVTLRRAGANVVVAAGPGARIADGATVTFFPYDAGLIDNAAAQTVARDGDNLTVTIPPPPIPLDVPARTGGLLVIGEGATRTAYAFAADAPGRTASATVMADVGLVLALAFAFLGGLILNLMPCVLPVLAMKALALSAQHGDGAARRRDGLAYTGGVLVTFAALAGVLIGLKSAGAEIGWGFQLQSPTFVAVIAYVLLALGLNLSGVFAIGGGVMGVGQNLTQRGGSVGAFFTGALAVVVATPCTAPFMGAAVGYAMTQPAAVTVAVFVSLGLGLAAPFLMLSVIPQAAKLVPRPGSWMNRLKEVLAFLMYGSAAWMVWVLSQQLGPEGFAAALAGLVLVALAAWLLGVAQNAGRPGLSVAFAAAALIGAVAFTAMLRTAPGPSAANAAQGPASEAWSPERVSALRAQGKPVFVNFTAAWCITCLMNERVALSTEEVKRAFAEREIVYLKADWTNRDAGIAQALAEFGRSGVPLYVFYPAGAGEPQVLPQLLTPGTVLAALAGS
jgi:thiol:disulfide interchange protein DsbD